MPYEIALDELMHHGILGMKWGKRNGPPYPLEYKKLSAEEKEKAKSKAIREGNIKEAAANINEFTNEELRQVRDRFNLNMEIAKITASTKKTGAQKVDKAIEWINRGTKAADAGSKAYNAFAKVANALNQDEDSQLPLIGEKKIPKNKAEGKTKQELLDMVKTGRLTNKEYKDIAERMENINKAEEYFKPKKKITYNDFATMIDHPENYTADEVKEGWEKFKTVNAVKATNDYKDYQDKQKEEKDFYGFYHGLVEEIEHSAKGTTWSKKDHKYVEKTKSKTGKPMYIYAQNKKQIDKKTAEADQLYSEIEVLQSDAEVYDKMAADANEYLKTGKAGKYTYTLSDGTKIKANYAKIFRKDDSARQAATKNLNTARNGSSAATKEVERKKKIADQKMNEAAKLAKDNARIIQNSKLYKFKSAVRLKSIQAKKWMSAAVAWLSS